GSGNFELDIERLPAPPYQFATDDVVRLRTRPLHSAGSASDRLIVTNVRPPRTLQVRLHSGSTFDPSRWPAGSIVMLPLRDPLNPTEDLTLVSPIIEAHITSSQGPLNAPRNAPQRACVANSNSVQWPRNLPTSLSQRYRRPFLVGLYEGG